MTEIISQLDPSGTFLRYLRGESPKNLLWVHGIGNNGKTTLLKTIEVLHPEAVMHIPLSAEDFEYALPKFVVVHDWEPDHLSLLQRLMASHPQTRFFIEANFAPPSDLDCEALPMTKRFK